MDIILIIAALLLLSLFAFELWRHRCDLLGHNPHEHYRAKYMGKTYSIIRCSSCGAMERAELTSDEG